MTTTEKVAAGTAALLSVAVIGVGTSAVLSDSPSSTAVVAVVTTPTQSCNDWGVTLTTGECQAAGIIRYVALYNLQGGCAVLQMARCEPRRVVSVNTYAGSKAPPQNIATWFGASIRNELESYFATGAPPMTYESPPGTVHPGIAPNPSPNACTGKVLAAPVITGVTPGQTDATVTIAPGG